MMRSCPFVRFPTLQRSTYLWIMHVTINKGYPGNLPDRKLAVSARLVGPVKLAQTKMGCGFLDFAIQPEAGLAYPRRSFSSECLWFLSYISFSAVSPLLNIIFYWNRWHPIYPYPRRRSCWFYVLCLCFDFFITSLALQYRSLIQLLQ